MAAITQTLLTADKNDVDANSFNTASITPTANYLILAKTFSQGGAGRNTPTLSGNGLTWVKILEKRDAADTQVLAVFRAMGATPSAGAVTIDFAGQSQIGCYWSISEFANINTTGTNGSGAIGNTASDSWTDQTNTGFTVTLAAFGSADNATYGAIRNSGVTIVPGTGFSELSETTGDSGWLEVEWKDSNDTSVDWTWASTFCSGLAIAIEIKNATTATTTSTSSSTSTTSTSTSTSTSTTSTSTSTSTSTTSTSTSSSTSTTSTSTSTSTSTTSTSTSSSTSTTTSTSTTSTSTSSSTSTTTSTSTTSTSTSTSTSTTSTSTSSSTSTTTSTSSSTSITTSTSTTSTSSSTSTTTTTSTSTSTTTTTSTSSSTSITTSTSSSTSTTTTWIYPFIVDTGEASNQAEMNFRVDSGV